MSFKLLTIGSMYPGNLKVFYKNHPETDNLEYYDHNAVLINETTEFSGVYTRMLRKSGIDAHCIIANDSILQRKWRNNVKKDSPEIQILMEQIRTIKPDVLWFENITYAGNGVLEKVKEEIKSVKLILAYHCSPFNINILNLLHKTDLVLTCTPGMQENFISEGLKTYLVYHAFDQSLLEKIDTDHEKKHNLIFSGSLTSGTGFHSNRISFIETMLKNDVNMDLYVNLESQLKVRAKQSIYFLSRFIGEKNSSKLRRHFPVFEYGKEPVSYYSELLLRNRRSPVYGSEMYDLFNMSKVVLNFHVGAAGNWAGNMRLFEVTGVGTCLLTDNKKNLSDLFEIGNEVVSFDNVDDCIIKAKWLLENDSEREKIALAGKKRTLKDHTVEKRCDLILDIINHELSQK